MISVGNHGGSPDKRKKNAKLPGPLSFLAMFICYRDKYKGRGDEKMNINREERKKIWAEEREKDMESARSMLSGGNPIRRRNMDESGWF